MLCGFSLGVTALRHSLQLGENQGEVCSFGKLALQAKKKERVFQSAFEFEYEAYRHSQTP